MILAFRHRSLRRHSNTVTCEWGGNEAVEQRRWPLRLPGSLRRKSAIDSELKLIGAVFAGLFGLTFGSFLNVVLARFPEEESILQPRSHCRHCEHVLAWWENVPVLSWILLRGRCRQCRVWIGIRYPLVELAIGLLWTGVWIKCTGPLFGDYGSGFCRVFLGCWGEVELPRHPFAYSVISLAGFGLLAWVVVALAALDGEFFWLPDWFTLPGIGLGFAFTVARAACIASPIDFRPSALSSALSSLFAIIAASGLILIIRLAYWLVRRVEGMGLGDAKLMAMLGAWLGLRGALECFAIAIFGACVAAFLWLGILAIRRSTTDWGKMPLPLGTFLCAAAISEIFYPYWLTAPMHLELLGLGR